MINVNRYEDAARLYCNRVGLDPDEPVTFPHPDGLAVHMKRMQWIGIAHEMARIDVMIKCIIDAES